MNSTVAERLRRVTGRQTLRLTHYGRKSGRPYEVTIWFIANGEKIYLATGNVNRQWVRNVKKTSRVRLRIDGELFDGEARFLTDRREAGHVMALVRRKYWMFLPFIAVWKILSKFGLAQFATGAFEVRLSQYVSSESVPGKEHP